MTLVPKPEMKYIIIQSENTIKMKKFKDSLQIKVTTLTKYITMLIIIFLLNGCTAYHYVSSPQYVPLYDQKGDIIANLSPKGLQLGYALTNGISIFACGSIDGSIQLFKDGGKENSGNKSGMYRQYSIDAGAGIFKRGRIFNYEILGGIGGGEITYKNEIDEWPNDYLSELNAKKIHIYVQPDFGYKLKDILVVGVFSKIIYERYFDVIATTQVGSAHEIEPYDYYFQSRQRADFTFIEPGLHLRTGFKHVKFLFECSRPLLLNNDLINYRKVNLFFGVSFSKNFQK